MPSAPSDNALQFMPARAKLWIGSLDDPQLEVRAQYNPKELQIDKAIAWGDHKAKEDGTGGKRRPQPSGSSQSDLELTTSPTRSMTLELLFDCYEQQLESIKDDIEKLETMSSNRAAGGAEEDRRPHHCVVAWGETGSGMKPFRCVIESLSVKYMVWDKHGVPLRATCTLKLKEAVQMRGSQGAATYAAKGRGAWVNDRGEYLDEQTAKARFQPVSAGENKPRRER